jgi:replicative DNA helicase
MFNLKPENKNNWEDVVKGISEGSRNETATKFVGKLLQTFAPIDWGTTVWEMLVMWNQRNSPPLGEVELRSVFNSVTARALRSGSHKKDSSVESDCDIKLISEIASGLEDDLSVSYPIGYPVFDKAFLGGLKEGDLVVVSGFTGMGKTYLCQSMTYNLVKSGQPCLWFSFEVTIGELWRKFKDMGVDNGFLAYSPEKTSNRNLNWVSEKIVDSRDRFKTKVVFIDHLGFLAEDPANYDTNLSSNYATKLTLICRRLKSIAVDNNLAIVLMAHLKKPQNSTSEPTVHDLKDSSGVGQEADAVILINRKKASSGYGDGEVYDKQSIVKIEKNRRTGQNKIFTVEPSEGRLIDSDTEFNNL